MMHAAARRDVRANAGRTYVLPAFATSPHVFRKTGGVRANAGRTYVLPAFATSSPRFQKNVADVGNAERVEHAEHARWVVTRALAVT